LDEIGAKAREHFVAEDAAQRIMRRGGVFGDRMLDRIGVQRDAMMRAETIIVSEVLGLGGDGDGDDANNQSSGFEEFPSHYDAPPSFDDDDEPDAHPLEVWLHAGLSYPPTADYLHPPGPHRQFDQVSKPLEDRLEVVKFNTIREWYVRLFIRLLSPDPLTDIWRRYLAG
jgi:hypothetical protein